MKIDIKEIRIIGGEFRILPPEPGITPGPVNDESKLMLGCQFAMMSNRGELVASGTISNSPTAASNEMVMNPETLKAFAYFFNCLRDDVANALEHNHEETDVLASILGQRTAR